MRRIICALTLAILASTACHRMKQVSLDQAPGSDRAWVTFSDQTRVLVFGPKLMGTKLVGFVNGRYDEFPAANVTDVMVRESARGRTTVLVVASVLVVGGVLYAVAGTGGAGSTHITDLCDEDPDNPICTQ